MDQFDALLFDLDGVVYVGPDAVPHAAASIAQARARGAACVFVTNNAARPARSVAEHLTAIGVPATVDEVVTSPEAAASLLPDFVPDGAKVLVIGGEGIRSVLVDRGYVPVSSLDDQPAAVMQGYSPDLDWKALAEATFAVRTGIPWIATNPDLTFPTARGVAPGNGAFVEIVGRTAGRVPDAVAGKPEPPLLHEAIRRSGASRPLMIGDRLDTDIEAGWRVGVPTLLVMTGVTTVADLFAALPHERPDFVGEDLRVLLDPYPDVMLDAQTGEAQCRDARAHVRGGRVSVAGGDYWDRLRAAAAAAWRAVDDQRLTADEARLSADGMGRAAEELGLSADGMGRAAEELGRYGGTDEGGSHAR